MNSENQASLIASLKSISRSLELLLLRLDRIEERLADLSDVLPDEDNAND